MRKKKNRDRIFRVRNDHPTRKRRKAAKDSYIPSQDERGRVDKQNNPRTKRKRNKRDLKRD